MGLFLKLVPIIADLTAAMVDSLEGRLEAHAKAGQDLVIGPVYLGEDRRTRAKQPTKNLLGSQYCRHTTTELPAHN